MKTADQSIRVTPQRDGNRRLRWVGAVLIVCTTILAAGCGGDGSSGSGGAGSDRLTVLSGVAPVADAFNADKGHPRLLLILSPT
jgi:hypothetical protein